MSYVESVPVGLWRKLSERFALPGDPVRRQWNDVVALNEKLVGFPGAIGITPSDRDPKIWGEDTPISFNFWTRFPAAESYSDNNPIFIVRAGAFRAGIWAYGSGEKMREEVYIDFGFHTQVSLMTDKGKAIARFISLMTKLTAELSTGVVGESFWERERWPNQVYDEP